MPEFVCTSNGDRTLIGQGSSPYWSGGDCSLQWRPLVSGVLYPDWPRRTMGPSGGKPLLPDCGEGGVFLTSGDCLDKKS